MNAAATKCRRCHDLVKWATTEAGKAIPLNPNPTDPGADRAFVLVGDRALVRAAAVQRIGELFDEDDERADRRAMSEYSWHIAHFATCTRPYMRDEP